MTQIKKRELNAMDTVADDLLANIDGYERVELAEKLYELIKKEPQKALDVLEEAIADARESCIYYDICPDCGKKLKFIKTGYDADINATYGYMECERCHFTVEV